MVAIADKFGKASKSAGYAAATTVKTARIAGVGVLEAFDLSQFATDTPVFFITYKKTIDPVTNIVTIISQVSWKALVNDVNNTLTNLTVAPGNTDLGNDVGDFIECIPTSYWETSLIDGLLTSLNPDGTLKTSAVQAALNISGAVPADWNLLATVPTVTSNPGNKEHVFTFAGVDYTDRLQSGTKLRVPRSVAPGTQSIKMIAASSQYAAKTSPAAMTWTTTFTLEGIVNFDGYTATDQAIVGRYNGTSGFILHIDPTGRVVITGIGRNGRSIRSVPVGIDTHIAGSINMTTGDTHVYIDGVDVPITLFGSGTSITQAGDFQIGRYNNTAYLNGSVSNVRVWNTVRTAAQIRDNAHVKLVGNEAGLVFATKDDGTFNDLTANGNNLTSFNGAIATNPVFPFKAVEFGFITKVTKPGADTIVTVFGGRGFVPSTGFTAVAYSAAGTPFGFPRSRGKWQTEAWFNATLPGKASGTTVGVWYGNADHAVQVNTGDWRLFWESPVYSTNSSGALSQAMNSLSTSLTAETHKRLSTTINEGSNVSSFSMAVPAHAEDSNVSLAAQTLFYPTVCAPTSTDGTKAIFFDNSYSVLRIVAECPYL